MDPLSVAASVVGLLGAAHKITTTLHSLVFKVRDAPSLARTVVTEVSDISAALGQLQAYVLGTANANPARSNLILLQQVVATLTGCVTTYSELEAAIDGLGINAEMAVFDRAVWSIQEPRITAIVQRLQNHKISLTLMLAILQCKSQQEAQDSMQKLQDSVDKLVRTNQDLAARLNMLEKEGSTISGREDGDVSTIKSNRTSRSLRNRLSLNLVTRSKMFTFENDLQLSRVYRKAVYRHSQLSQTSSALFSTALSVFSNLSLSQISNVSVYALPVYAIDLYNNQWYTFGDTGVGVAQPSKLASKRSEVETRSLKNPRKWIWYTPSAKMRPKIYGPENPVHVTHVGYDEQTGELNGLPREWQLTLERDDISETEQKMDPKESIDVSIFYKDDGYENPRAAPPAPRQAVYYKPPANWVFDADRIIC